MYIRAIVAVAVAFVNVPVIYFLSVSAPNTDWLEFSIVQVTGCVLTQKAHVPAAVTAAERL